MSVWYFYSMTSGFDHTLNDVVLVGNASNFLDGGRIENREGTFEQQTIFVSTLVRSNAHAFKFLSADANLSIGGNYDQTRNIWYQVKRHYQETAAVKYNQNGTVYFSAQTGSPGTGDTSSSGIFNPTTHDYKIDVNSSNTWDTRFAPWMSSNVYILSGDSSCYSFLSEKKLTVGGDFYGTITSTSRNTSTDFSLVTGTTITPWNTSLNNKADSAAFFARTGNFVLKNNFRGTIISTSKTNMRGFATPTVTGNTAVAYGIFAGQDVLSELGVWSSTGTENGRNASINVTSNDSILEAVVHIDGDPSKDFAVAVGTDKPVNSTASAVLANNKLAAIAVKAGNTITVRELRDFSINATADNNWLRAEATLDNGSYPSTVTLDNNVVESIGFDGVTLNFGLITSGTTIDLSTSGNSLFWSANIGTSSFNNNLSAIGFRGTTINLGRFDGNINITVDGNTYDAMGYFTSAGFTVTTMNSSDNLYGSITITNQNNYNDIWVEAHRTLNVMYGVKADNMNVNGIIYSNITINANNNNNGDSSNISRSFDHQTIYGIRSNRFYGESFAGNITVNADQGYSRGDSAIGFQLSSDSSEGGAEVMTRTAGDAFDVNGNIVVANQGNIAFGITSYYRLNLRVSGMISASTGSATHGWAYAIRGDLFCADNPQQTLFRNDVGNKDVVEIAAGARIVGKINLGTNENNIIISSQASLDGGVENGGGKDNIKFMLDGKAAATPIVIGYAYSVNEGDSQRQNESSLTSGSSITINLNNAVNKEIYTLYEYKAISGDPDSVWGVGKTREVTIEYQGVSKTIFTVGGYGTFDMSTDSTGKPTGLTANGYIQYNSSDNTVKVYVDNVIPPVVNPNRSLSAQTIQNSKNVLLSWSGGPSAGVFEVEYKLNGGKSIVVKLTGDKKELLLENVDYGSQIEWKVRENIGDGSQLSGWNQSSYVTYPVRPGEIGASPSNPKGSNPDSSDTGITASIAKFAWEKNNSPNVVEYYEIEYFESELLLTAEQLAAKWANPALDLETSTGITKKTTTATELIVSGLTNQRFIYWRTRSSYETVNNDGSVVSDNKSGWQNGDLFRVWVGDYSRPTFIGTVSCTPNYQDNSFMTVNFDWSKAVADDPGFSGVKKFVIYYKKVGDSWSDADAVKSKSITRGDATTGADFDRQMTTISDIGTGMYEWRVVAVDYVGNESVYQYGNLFGDNLAPVFDQGHGLNLAFSGNDMIFSWNAASDINSNNVSASGLAKYQLVYNYVDNDGRAQTKTVDVDKYSTSITLDGLKTLAKSDTNFTWSLSAFDVAGNRVNVSDGKTILIDKNAPAGYPDHLLSPGPGGVHVDWVTPPPGSGQTRNIAGSASFSISWDYIGQPDPSGIIYEVEFSNDENFLSSGKNFSVMTTDTSITFNSDAYYSVGKVAALGSGTVYWRIKLLDGQGNTNGNYTIYGPLLFTAQNPSTNYNWETIKDTIAPTQASNLNATVARDSINTGKSKMTLTWNAAYDGFGVKEYQVKVTSKNGYNHTYTVDGSKNSLTISDLADGDYTWTVNTVDHSKNQSGYTTKQNIAVNTNPPKPVEGLFSQGFNSEVYLTWAPQQSTWAFDHYSIGFAIKGSNGLSWTQSKTNSLMLAGLVDGEYEYFVFAEDKAGNQGDHVTGSFRIESALDLSNSRNTATRLSFNPGMLSFQHFEASYTIDGNFTQLSTVGLNDKEDSMVFSLPKSSRVGLNLTVYGEKAYGKNTGITATVYNSRGKKVKSFSVKNGFNRLDVLLEANGGSDYYITLTAKNKKSAVAYDFAVDRTDYDIHNDDDNWQSLSGQYVKNYDTSSDYQYLTRTVVNNENGSGTANWIGFGDLKDYRKVTVNTAGKYNFVLRGLTNKARMTVFTLNNGKLKKVKAITGKIGDVATGNLLIDSLGAGKEYYILVESLDGKKDKNSNYTVDMVTDVVFNRGINGDDSMDLSRASYRIPVTTNSTYNFQQYAYNNSSEREWIGFGDAVDYRYIGAVDSPMNYSFRISGLQDKTKVSIGYLVNGKFKAVKTLTGTAAKSDLSFNGILNKTGYEYFIKVEAPNAAKGSSSDYILEFNGTTLPPAKSDIANDKPAGATQLAANAAQTNYVGYGDLRDYFAFNVQNNGRLDLSGLTAQAKVTLYSVDAATGKLIQIGAKGQLVSDAIQFANLSTGNYQLLIEAADKGKTQHSYFTVGLTE